MLAIRGPFAMAGGALAAVALFFGLARLVSAPFAAPQLAEARRIVFTPQIVATPVEPIRRHKPTRKPPEPTVVEPRGPTVTVDPFPIGRPAPIEVVKPARRGLPIGIDGDVMPRVRVPPEYPPPALARNIEGWVRVRFTVTAIGTVSDAVVVASEPRTIFDDAALKALARWRYNPRVANGEAVERVGLETVFRFELEN